MLHRNLALPRQQQQVPQTCAVTHSPTSEDSLRNLKHALVRKPQYLRAPAVIRRHPRPRRRHKYKRARAFAFHMPVLFPHETLSHKRHVQHQLLPLQQQQAYTTLANHSNVDCIVLGSHHHL